MDYLFQRNRNAQIAQETLQQKDTKKGKKVWDKKILVQLFIADTKKYFCNSWVKKSFHFDDSALNVFTDWTKRRRLLDTETIITCFTSGTGTVAQRDLRPQTTKDGI